MFQIFEIQGKRLEYSNNIRAKKLSNPNIRDSGEKIRIQIIRSSLFITVQGSTAVIYVLCTHLPRLPQRIF